MSNASISTPADPLWTASVDVIRRWQAPSGAFVASPHFRTYHYSWLRDGSFIAHALDVAGEREAAGRFHDWVTTAVTPMTTRIQKIIELRAAGEVPPVDIMLPTRYTLDGQQESPSPDAWPNFQLDGYGTWLWALQQHLGAQPLTDHLRATAKLVGEYLLACWDLACYDYWEEYGDRRHTSTLASIAAGLRAAGELLQAPELAAAAERVRETMLREATVDGCLVKGARDHRPDASLLAVALPFGVLEPADPLMRATAEAIEARLTSPGGGVWRYPGDTYYGGGAWVLLTCWLGWYWAVTGQPDRYRRCREWVRAQADAALWLPEQVIGEAQHPSYVDEWLARWGEPAHPLLWSHAMYLLMEHGGRAWS